MCDAAAGLAACPLQASSSIRVLLMACRPCLKWLQMLQAVCTMEDSLLYKKGVTKVREKAAGQSCQVV